MTNTSAPEQEPLPNEIGGKKSDANLSTQQTELPSRYWTFLFDNLKRSIEQIYQTCESDQNAAQCQVKTKQNSVSLIFFPYDLGSRRISLTILSRIRNSFKNMSTSRKSR